MEKKDVYEEYIHWRNLLFFDHNPDAFLLTEEEKILARKFALAKRAGFDPDEMGETWFHEYLKMPVLDKLADVERRIDRLKKLYGG